MKGLFSVVLVSLALQLVVSQPTFQPGSNVARVVEELQKIVNVDDITNYLTQAQKAVQGTVPQVGPNDDSVLGLGFLSQGALSDVQDQVTGYVADAGTELSNAWTSFTEQAGEFFSNPLLSRVVQRQSEGGPIPANFSLPAEFQTLMDGFQNVVNDYAKANEETIKVLCGTWDAVQPPAVNLGVYSALTGQATPTEWGGLLGLACSAMSPEYAESQKGKTTTTGLLTPAVQEGQKALDAATANAQKLVEQGQDTAKQLIEQGQAAVASFAERLPANRRLGTGLATGTTSP